MADADLKAKRKAWRQANAEKVKAYQRAYYQANKEKANAYSAAHYRANVESYKQKAAAWAEQNADKRYEIAARWRDEHPEVYAAARKKDWLQNKEKRMKAGREFRRNNPEVMQQLRRAWHERFPEANAHHVGLRRTRKMQAMPAWADTAAIKAIYRAAKEASKATGIEHHVDHFYPLKGETVCGLHNEFNLRVISAAENQSKKNKVPEVGYGY